jgi:hypothetical protein|tara:strand:- start:203 stop:328 length:126 start_codon:yes stop_codon:yes gene_type:complete
LQQQAVDLAVAAELEELDQLKTQELAVVLVDLEELDQILHQ